MTDNDSIFTYERKEELAAAWDEEATQWVFRPVSVSSYFTFSMTEEWPDRVYADYYKDFWAPMLEQLKGRTKPATIYLKNKYSIGQEDEATIRQFMEEWLPLQPGYLAVAQPEKEGEQPKFVHFHIQDIEVTDLRVETSEASPE